MADWSKLPGSGKVVDRRGAAKAAGGFGLIGAIIFLGFNYLTTGEIDPNQVINQLQNTQVSQQQVDTSQFEGNDEYEQFTEAVLGSVNTTWQEIFEQNNQQYSEPTLVLFRDSVRTDCGGASSQVGPFYCPTDSTIYLDETFFDVLTERFGAKGGDVAEAYVIAHEGGHHVQAQLGSLTTGGGSNDQQIQTELQADCYAGIWAYSLRDQDVFQQGEIEEAIDAAAAVGDDRIQESTTGQVNPETWTHGSSEQRVGAFRTGYTSGDPSKCE